MPSSGTSTPGRVVAWFRRRGIRWGRRGWSLPLSWRAGGHQCCVLSTAASRLRKGIAQKLRGGRFEGDRALRPPGTDSKSRGDVDRLGLDDLLGMGETEPIAGHRIEFSPLRPGGFRSSLSALIDADDQTSVDKLMVDRGRLRLLNNTGSLENTSRRTTFCIVLLQAIVGTTRRPCTSMRCMSGRCPTRLKEAKNVGSRQKRPSASFGNSLDPEPGSHQSSGKRTVSTVEGRTSRCARNRRQYSKSCPSTGEAPEDERVSVAAELLDEP